MPLNSQPSPAVPLARRNAGPQWGFDFLCRANRWLPGFVLRPLLQAGTWFAVATMPEERRYSREYLEIILDRAPTWRDIYRHFFAFTEMFMLRLRVAEGEPHGCVPQPGCEDFEALMASGEPALLGTFHIGNSDLLGFQLGHYKRRVHMIRLRVGNSADTARLVEQFGEWVTYIWVNETENLLFALKNAAQSGGTIALKCDRPDYSARREAFDFLGERRWFPFTIYHLALVFRLPVVFCTSTPGPGGSSLLYSSPIYRVDGADKAENLARARRHFQDFLDVVAGLLRENPWIWFNFTPMNPRAVEPEPALQSADRSVAQSC